MVIQDWWNACSVDVESVLSVLPFLRRKHVLTYLPSLLIKQKGLLRHLHPCVWACVVSSHCLFWPGENLNKSPLQVHSSEGRWCTFPSNFTSEVTLEQNFAACAEADVCSVVWSRRSVKIDNVFTSCCSKPLLEKDHQWLMTWDMVHELYELLLWFFMDIFTVNCHAQLL